MNNTIAELMERKSVRAFTDREISSEAREMILQAAMAAPTAGNQQLYTILDITDCEKDYRVGDIVDFEFCYQNMMYATSRNDLRVIFTKD